MSPHPLHPPADPLLAVYLQAVDTLLQWQLSPPPPGLPACTRSQLREDMDLFISGHPGQSRKVTPDAAECKLMETAFDCIADNIMTWPLVYVHGDSMMGPITCEIARLTRDARLPWAEDFCLDVTIRYWEKARKAGLAVGEDFGEFYRAVEWMGLQQHLAQAGKGQSPDLTPQLISHIRHTCHRYREFRPLARLVEKLEGIQVAQSYAFGRT